MPRQSILRTVTGNNTSRRKPLQPVLPVEVRQVRLSPASRPSPVSRPATISRHHQRHDNGGRRLYPCLYRQHRGQWIPTDSSGSRRCLTSRGSRWINVSGLYARSQGIKFLRLLWCNGAGLRSCRVIPLDRDPLKREAQVKRLASQVGGEGRGPEDDEGTVKAHRDSAEGVCSVPAVWAVPDLRSHVLAGLGRRAGPGQRVRSRGRRAAAGGPEDAARRAMAPLPCHRTGRQYTPSWLCCCRRHRELGP